MFQIPFKIFPSSGYLNSQFQIVFFEGGSTQLTIKKDGLVEREINRKEDQLIVLLPFNKPGIYTLTTNANNKVYSQNFEVKDSLLLGSSEIKSTFVFDNIPYSFILMKDRMLIYDEINHFVLTEYNISPSEIIQIDQDFLLFITRFKGADTAIANYALYSIKNFRIVWELKNFYKEIRVLRKEKLLWTNNFKDNAIVCFSFKNIVNHQPETILSFTFAGDYNDSKVKDHLLIEEKNRVAFINVKTAKVVELQKKDDVAIDIYGNCYHKSDTCSIGRNALVENPIEIKVDNPPPIILRDKQFIFIGSAYEQIITDTFDSRCQELIAKYYPNENEHVTKKHCGLTEDEQPQSKTQVHSIYLSKLGLYIKTKTTIKSLRFITFRKDIHGSWQPKLVTTENNTFTLDFYTGSESHQVLTGAIDYTLIFANTEFLFFVHGPNVSVLKGTQLVTNYEQNFSNRILADFESHSYLLLCLDNGYCLFSFLDFGFPILKDVDIFNFGSLRDHGVIWYAERDGAYETKRRSIKAFHLLEERRLDIHESKFQHSEFKSAEDYIFHKQYFLSSTQTIINPANGEVLNAAIGNLVAISESLRKILVRRADLIYMLQYDSIRKKFADVELKFEELGYKESYLSPDGNYLVLEKSVNEYVLYDIEKQQEISFFSGKFLAFSKEGNLIVEKNNSRTAIIVDPLTHQDITPPNYHFYRFLSPDGSLYSQVSTKRRCYDRVREQYIDAGVIQKYRTDFEGTPNPENQSIAEQILKNRQEFFKLYEAKLHELSIDNHEDIDLSLILKHEHYTEIGIVSTQTMVEIQFPLDLVFFNYGSFSYDNKYFGYVGKPSSNGIIHLFKINFDKGKQTLEIVDEYVTRIPKFAPWVCGFSKLGLFATYDSAPDTYIFDVSDRLFEKGYSDIELKNNVVDIPTTIFSTFKECTIVKGKNFLCFSPSGKYMALSEQGYEPLTLGGYGHQESGALHIALPSGRLFKSFLEHGDSIKENRTKKLVFVAFSADEKKIMSLSKDGVVIVRNIAMETKNSEANRQPGMETKPTEVISQI